MPPALLQIDAFTDRAFAGNPAAVCLLDGPAGAGWMQSLASEMNLSETAFLHAGGDGYALRWFTPVAEVELCGHATLASAHALWETGRAAPGAPLAFATLSGTLTAWREGEWIVMDFPATPPAPAEPPAALAAALGLAPRWSGRTRFDWLVEAESPGEVAAARPDMAALAALDGRGVILTAAGGAGADVTSRYFAPSFGIPEDPVTGSAHCALAPHWGARLGRDRLVCHQASPRGGIVRTELRGDRVLLAGRAVTVLEGRLAAGPPP
jgi:PhzF family phenazine biosynthesis protein